jgi:hypothetical protein
MKARLTWLDFLLAALLVLGCWAVVAQYRKSASRVRIFETEPVAKNIPASPAIPTAPPVYAADYVTISGRLFFVATRDARRGSSLERVEAVGAGPALLPVLFGIADLGEGPSALLAAAPGARARWISPGASIGGYLLREISDTELVFARGGRSFAFSPTELRAGRVRLPARPAGAVGVRRPQSPRVSRAPVTARLSATRNGHRIGTEFRPGRFAADAGDGAGDGTVFEGYVRRVRETPFGEQHWWEKRDP